MRVKLVDLPCAAVFFIVSHADQPALSRFRLYLEQYRELTVLQPTWCLFRSRFDELDGYLRRVDFALEEETKEELRLAEDLRFWHKHMAKDGRLVLAPSDGPLLMYRHSEGLSQR